MRPYFLDLCLRGILNHFYRLEEIVRNYLHRPCNYNFIYILKIVNTIHIHLVSDTQGVVVIAVNFSIKHIH